MGVYVPEINMPKGESNKLVLKIPNGEVYDEHGIRLGITNWAKAVPIPPHGRLIDADALAKDYDGPPVRIDPWVWNELSHAPTIIESEEEDG